MRILKVLKNACIKMSRSVKYFNSTYKLQSE